MSTEATAVPEDRYAGRALAWGGALATVLGLALLLVMAAAHGWLGREARVIGAAAISALLFLAGGRLYERRGRTDAAKAMAAAGIAGLDGALLVATSSYHLLAPLLALAAALLVAVGATGLCLRWDAGDLAGTAMLAALAAPFALGVDGGPVGLAFLAVAFAAVAWVCVRRDWSALALGAFAIVTPQWVAILGDTDGTTAASALVFLVLFLAIGAAASAGLEVRERRSTLRRASSVMLALNAIVTAGVGYAVLYGESGPGLAKGWLAAVAAAHLAGGLRGRRMGAELRLTALTLGVLLGDIAVSAVLGGVWLAAAWAGSTLLFAALHRARPNDHAVGGGLAMHASLAVGHLLLIDAQPSALHDGFDAPGLLSLSLVASACLVSAQLSRARWRIALQAVALAIAAYGTFAVGHGGVLVVALAIEAVSIGRFARHEDAPVAAAGAVAYLGLALATTLVQTDALTALQTGVGDPLAGAATVAACAVAAALLSRPLGTTLAVAAAATLLYGISIELLAGFAHGHFAAAGAVQRGQAVLSALYAVIGVAAVVAGLLRDHRVARVAGLALLALAAGKVLVYDLAELTEIYRVLSCIALGLLLLAGAFAWQWLRPSALGDLRSIPAPLR